VTETLTQRLLAAVLDDEVIGDDLVRALASSSDAHGELVRLAGVLARLPGDGARAAEERLDRLFDDVALAAATGSQAMPAGTRPHQAASTATHARPRVRRIARLVSAGVAAAVAVVIAAVAWPRHDASVATSRDPDPLPARVVVAQPAPAPPVPPPAEKAVLPEPAEKAVMPALVRVEIRVHPATASIAIDDKPIDGNPFSGTYAADGAAHRIRLTSAGYQSKVIAVAFNGNVLVDVSLERSASSTVSSTAVAIAPPAALPAGPSAENSRPPARVAMPETPAPSPAPPAQAAAPPAGKIHVAIDLPGYEVAVDDRVVATTPLAEPLRVSAGRHTVSVTRDGYAAVIQVLDVGPGRTVQLTLPAAALPAIDAAGGKRPRRPIDPANPYGGSP
jgi:PEGA domain